MRKRVLCISLVFCFVLGMMPAGVSAETDTPTGDYVDNQLIVVFDDSVSDKKIERIAEESDASVDVITDAPDGQKACQVTLDDDTSIEEAMESFNEDKRVDYVQPNYIYSCFAADPFLNKDEVNYQYQFDTTNAFDAWDLLKERVTEPTTVAVIDTGVDIDHEDLQKNLLKDKYIGCALGSIDRDINDDSGDHGTHCTGIIGATYGNGLGGAGIASGYDNDLVKVMTVCASPDGENLYSLDVLNSIKYILDDGEAKVVSMSFGFYGRDRLVNDAMKMAYNEGMTLIAASGNEDVDDYSIPMALPEVIGINASNADGQATFWSNYGDYSDLSAPGNAILSTMPGDNYETMSGTSMATPCAAGIAALVLDANPSLTNSQVRNILCATAKESASGLTFNQELGYGNIDAKAAVEAAINAGTGDVSDMDVRAGEKEIPAGTETSLRAVTYPADVLADVTYESSDESVATVDAAGNIYGIAEGTATITASAGGKSKSVEITVTESKAPAKMVIDRGTVGDEIGIGEYAKIEAHVEPEDAVNGEIVYESSDPDIVFVGDDGEIIAKDFGKVTITCTNYDGTVSDSFELTVKNLPDEISITSGKSSVKLGTTAVYKGKLTEKKGIGVANDYITWGVSNSSKASIDKNGVLTPKKAGKVYVTAKYYTPNLDEIFNQANIIKAKKQIVMYDKEYKGKAYGLKQKAKTKKSVTLSWKRIPKADGYNVYRASKKNGKYKRIKVINKGSQVKVKLKAKKKQYYKIKAFYRMDDGSKKFYNFKDSSKILAKVKK